MRVAERLGAGADGFVFGRFGIVDVELAFALMRLIATGFDMPPDVAAYARAVWARPAMREFADHVRPPHPTS